MSETVNSEAPSEIEKPAPVNDTVQFPPFPEPSGNDFDEDVSEEERNFYKSRYPDINDIKKERLHCTACDKHLGCAPRNESRMRMHPMLRALVCNTCHTFYNSGEFEKGDDGSELYCRWCGQGGQVYCCSDCPHVFCAKCIKRNFGMPKIKEIENTDDWKCFKCKPECLWSIRALCWALLRFCDLRNKFAFEAKEASVREAYQKACAVDDSVCCKHKVGRKKKDEKEIKKKDTDSAKKAANAIAKIPPTIQVKKFASMMDETSSTPIQKKAQKRPASPKPFIVRSSLPNTPRFTNPMAATMAKRPRMTAINPMPGIRLQPKNINTYPRARGRPPGVQMAVLNNFNGFNPPMQPHNFVNPNNYMNNMVFNDNINLSLESLTQGLDMSGMAGMPGMPNNRDDDDVVCTPDFPLEPLCQVTEENNDDDVECITPGPSASQPPPLLVAPPAPAPAPAAALNRFTPSFSDLSSDNIIQMTENDVTVNAATGGLKFRVDPQTLSSNKMYRLPDGRIFAINANPNMPGGFSATIVAVTESNSVKNTTKGSMYAAKLSAVTSAPKPRSPVATKQTRTEKPKILNTLLRRNNKSAKSNKKVSESPTTSRSVDTNVPVEWYRYNLLDAVDSLQYSISRLHKLKKETSGIYLRTRTVDEMKNLHKQLDRLLGTSAIRFTEIRNNLNREMKQYLARKTSHGPNISDGEEDDDDDVEILNDQNENDDPIFIDENSMDSSSVNEMDVRVNTTHEVDLTGGASSEHNNSVENITETYDKDPLSENTGQPTDDNAKDDVELNEDSNDNSTKGIEKTNDLQDDTPEKEKQLDESSAGCDNKLNGDETSEKGDEEETTDEIQSEKKDGKLHDEDMINIKTCDMNEQEISQDNIEIKDHDNSGDKIESDDHDNSGDKIEINDQDNSRDEVENNEQDNLQDKIDSLQDSEMTEELIETLLKDNVGEEELQNLQSIVEISEEF